MKVPAHPKPLHELLTQESDNWPKVLGASVSPTPKGKYGKPFMFNTPPLVTQYLHEIDSRASGRIGMPSEVSNPETKTRYLVRSFQTMGQQMLTSSDL